jgi:hypothetical protein
VWNYGRLDVGERRRVRVLMIGMTSGTAAGAPLAIAYWTGARADFAHSSYLASPLFALGTILILPLPLSLTYAVLRHRLFDVRVIIRLGVRYALARGVLAALIPAIAAAMIVDALAHGDQPLLEVVVSRWRQPRGSRTGGSGHGWKPSIGGSSVRSTMRTGCSASWPLISGRRGVSIGSLLKRWRRSRPRSIPSSRL